MDSRWRRVSECNGIECLDVCCLSGGIRRFNLSSGRRSANFRQEAVVSMTDAIAIYKSARVCPGRIG